MLAKGVAVKASDLFVKQLEQEGVEYVFGLPGEEVLDLLESLRKSRIKVIITRHEQAAAFMAAAYGRLTGKAGVCVSTLGPGATNLVTGVAHANLIGAPLIAITGQKVLRQNWQARFQLLNIVGLMQPITKRSVSIADADSIPTVIRNAFKLSLAERPGAVHIELPEDVAEAETGASIQKPGLGQRPMPAPDALECAVSLINSAKYPLVIVSSGANRNLKAGELELFLESAGLYAVHTQMGKGALSDASERSLFAAGIHRHDYVNCGIDRADLIITLGYHIVEYPPYIWNSGLDKKIVHIDLAEAETDRYYNPDVEVIGDMSAALRSLADRISRKDGEVYRSIRRFLIKKLAPEIKCTFPPTPQEIVRHVRDVLAEDDIITLDNGIYKLWFSRLYKTYRPNTYLVDNALATMGAGLPYAIAAKMLYPGKKVLAVVGDGGFMMNSQEMETAVRLNLPIVVLILNDNAFGFVKWEQMNKGFPVFGTEYGNPDFVRYAESYGAEGMRLEKTGSLSGFLEKAFSRKRPVVIECPVDYSVNYEAFSKEIANIVCDIQ